MSMQAHKRIFRRECEIFYRIHHDAYNHNGRSYYYSVLELVQLIFIAKSEFLSAGVVVDHVFVKVQLIEYVIFSFSI